MTQAAFICGPLLHAPLLDVVLGRVLGRGARPASARLAGHRVVWDGLRAGLVAAEAVAQGAVLVGLSDAEWARLERWHLVQGLTRRACRVETGSGEIGSGGDRAGGAGSGEIGAICWGGGDGPDWDADDWQARFAEIWVALAAEVMALPDAPEALAGRLGPLAVRAASRLRAEAAGPVALRHRQGRDDVAVAALRRPYGGFFAVEERDLQFRRFDGTLGPRVTRATFVMGDAVTVLPYDPARDRVLLVEQFRAGPMARGAGECWSLEAIAGRIDAGESPEQAARREAVEEAGLALGALLPVAGYYPSPGAVTEYLYSFVALTDLPDGAAGIFGLADEAEDIRGHLIGFERLMELVASGEVDNAPLILTALWLARERGRLRGV